MQLRTPIAGRAFAAHSHPDAIDRSGERGAVEAGERSLVRTRKQVPARAIIDDVEAMSDMEISAQGACAISAFEANDIVGSPRSPDRLRGLQNAGRLPRY